MLKNAIILIFTIVSMTEAKDINPRVRRDMMFRTQREHFHPCKDMMNVLWLEYVVGRPPGEENQYELTIMDYLWHKATVYLEFDSEASLTLLEPIYSRIETRQDGFFIRFFNEASSLRVQVKGPATGTIPYLKKVTINTIPRCSNTTTGYFDKFIQGYQNTAAVSLTLPDDSCGRRKLTHTALIVDGQPTQPGDWPWHAALYILDGSNLVYICGGTLISKTLILTAAHCTTLRGVPLLPDALSVILGKYNLIGGDIAAQEREVHEVIVHKEYDPKLLNNDIALLKLKTEAVYDDYVQPACLWYTGIQKKLPTGRIFGTVVGWGFNQADKLSPKLQQATIPKRSVSVCLKSNPVFYSKVLTPKKFCAGYRNGTSACNGDSGGSFSVFVPDQSGNASPDAEGAWYVRGIVSMTVARKDARICDPHQYVVFTDVEKYSDWMKNYIK